MKIRLSDVTVTRTGSKKNRIVAEKISLTLRSGDRAALVGCRGGNTEIIFDLISGAEDPTEGSIYREGQISWPLPRARFLSTVISGVAAARFVARMYGVDQDRYIKAILSIADVKKMLGLKLRQWQGAQRAEFFGALGLCLDFDFYLLEQLPVGRESFRENCRKAIKRLSPEKGLLLGAAHPSDVRDLCNQAYIMDGKELLYFPEMEAALKFCSEIPARDFKTSSETGKLAEGEEEEAEDDMF